MPPATPRAPRWWASSRWRWRTTWKHAFGVSFLYGEPGNVENARRCEVFGSSGYRLGDRSYVLGSLRNERDRFSGDEYQWTAGVGYGYETIDVQPGASRTDTLTTINLVYGF